MNDWQEKMQAEAIQNQQYAQGQVRGIAGGDCCQNACYQPSHAEQAEKRAAHHLEEASKAQQAAAFFRAHPEFEDFIKLIRNGAVSI